MRESKIKALIFDFDGTLSDTIGAIRKAINNTMQYYGYVERSYNEVRDAIGDGAYKLIERLIPKEKSADSAHVNEVLEYYNNEYTKTFRMSDCCYPGISHMVTEQLGRGYKLGILSNKPDRFIKELTLSLFQNGEITFAAGQTALPLKPNPAAALIVAEKLGANPEECAFIGDSEVDVLTGRNAKMMTVGCSWGYRDKELLRATGADIIIDRPEELLRHFL